MLVGSDAGIIHAFMTCPSVIEMNQGQTQGEKARPAFAVLVALDAGVAPRVHEPAPATHRGTGGWSRKVVVWIDEKAPGGFVMVHGPARPSDGSNVRCPVPRVDPDAGVAGWEPRSLPWPAWMAFWYGAAWEPWFDGLPAASRVGIAIAAAGATLPPCQAKVRRRDWDRLCEGTVEGKSI